MQIQKLLNANVYDGTQSWLGRAESVTLPEISVETDAHKALGMIGTIEVPTGLAAMTVKVKWNGVYPDAIKRGMNPFVGFKLQVRGSVEVYDADGLAEEKPLTVHLTVKSKKHALGDIAAQSANAQEQELSCTYIKVILAGEELVEIDVVENVWKVGGVDVRAQYRTNLGL